MLAWRALAALVCARWLSTFRTLVLLVAVVGEKSVESFLFCPAEFKFVCSHISSSFVVTYIKYYLHLFCLSILVCFCIFYYFFVCLQMMLSYCVLSRGFRTGSTAKQCVVFAAPSSDRWHSVTTGRCEWFSAWATWAIPIFLSFWSLRRLLACPPRWRKLSDLVRGMFVSCA